MKDKAKPIVTEVYSDNGELSHYRLIDPDTGENLWSEDPDEDKTLGYPVKSAPLVTDEETQDEVEKLFFQYCREEGMDDDDIKAASWRTGGMIDFGVWLQSRLSQPVNLPNDDDEVFEWYQTLTRRNKLCGQKQ